MEEPLMYEVSKFPVTTNKGEYLVNAYPSYVAIGLYNWKVKVYTKSKKKGIFRKEFKKVHTYETGWSSFNDWALDLIELVQESVKDYEKTLIQAEDHPVSIERREAVKKFNDWDGVIKEESQ